MPAALVKNMAEKQRISEAEAERRWAKAKDIIMDETELTEADGDQFWAYVTGVFKKSMGITESAILEAGTSYMQRLSGAEMVMPAQDNLQWVMDRKINYMDAMYRSDLGWIAFLWGREGSRSSDYMDGWGIANILIKDAHNAGTEDTLMQAVEAVARGRIKRKYGPPGNRRVEILWQGFVARLAWHRGRKTWYLAGWPGLVAEDPEEEQVTESAKPFDWKQAIQNAQTIDDIQAVFRRLFADDYDLELAEIRRNAAPNAAKKARALALQHVRGNSYDIARVCQRVARDYARVDVATAYIEAYRSVGRENGLDVSFREIQTAIDDALSVVAKKDETPELNEEQASTEETAMVSVTLECNDIKCKHRWTMDVDPARIVGNRLTGLETCPKCGRYDSPYVVKEAPAPSQTYRYGLQLRPPTNGGVPHGLKFEWDRDYKDQEKGILHGAITTDRKLTDKEIENFDLVDLNDDQEDVPEFTRFNKAMQKKYGGAGWMLGATKEEYAKYKDLEAKLPGELKALYAQKHGNKPLVLKMKTRDLGAMITSSTKEPGHTQLTYFDEHGFSGDRQFKTEDDAIRDAYQEGYTEFAPDWLDDISISEKFMEGNKKTYEIQAENERTAKKLKAINLTLDMKALIDTPDARPTDIPEDWIIMNAPRPLVGDKEWRGDFRHGVFYAAIDPNNDDPPGAEWRIQKNKDLDAWVVTYVSKDVMAKVVRAGIADMKYYQDRPEIIEKMMQNDEAVRQSFFNTVENKTVAEVEKILATLPPDENLQNDQDAASATQSTAKIKGYRTKFKGKKPFGDFIQRSFGTYIALDRPFYPDFGDVYEVEVNIAPSRILDPNGLFPGTNLKKSQEDYGKVGDVINSTYDTRIKKFEKGDRHAINKMESEVMQEMGYDAEVGWIDGPQAKNRELVVFDRNKIREIRKLEKDAEGRIMESAIYEMAMSPHEIDHSNWERAIETAVDMDEVSNVFKILFGVKTDADASPFFESTDKSVVIPLDRLVRREAPDPKRVEHAHEYMQAAKDGTGAKRGPIKVCAMGNGKFKFLDGNTILHALQALGETKAVVEIEPTLLQPGVKDIDGLYVQAEEAQPMFMNLMKQLGEKTGGKVMVRPGLKKRERVLEKIAADKHGRIDDIKDILAGTLVFDTVDDVIEAFEAVKGLDPVFRIKNRYEKPLPTGYRDIFLNVSLPNGHIAELQINTQTMIDAKKKGIGHKIYDVARQLSPVAEKASGDLKFIARGMVEELNDISRKVYNQAAAASLSRKNLARASAKDLAAGSATTEAFDLILNAISESSILSQVDLSLPPMENVSQESLSKAKGLSSHSKNSRAMSFPPSDDVTENLTEALKEVKHIVGNPATAFLYDNTPVRVQYAIVEAGDLKTSHDDSMALSPDYPQEVQPRQRERGAMQLQIKEMANKLNPERMAASPQASTGAPIVGPDLAVESGNGRTMALRHAYQAGPVGKSYREWLIQHSQEFGMPGTDVAAMKQPVLVRMRVGKVPDRAQFARDANKDELAQMSPVEVAKMDAETLTEADLSLFAPSDDGNIGASSNTAFINKFVQKLGVNESAGYLTADGRPTKQLVDRIQAAIFQKAYKDESVLALVAEETNPALRNILSGLTYAAKDFVQARAFAADFDGIDITKHAIEAGRLVRKSRDDNVVIDEVLGQRGLFSDIPEGTQAFARFIDKHIRSGKRLGRVFQVAAEILKDHLSMRDQAALFDKPKPPTEAEIINMAIAKVEEEFSDKNGGLFESAIVAEGAVGNAIVRLIDKIAPKYLVQKNLSRFKTAVMDCLKKKMSGRAIMEQLIQEGFPKNAVVAFLKQFTMETEQPILENALSATWQADIMGATSIGDIARVFARLFGAAAVKVKESLTDYKDNENSDYGLKVKGIKAREKLNDQAREIIGRVTDPAKLTQEEIGILKQYSGKGGLTENSQYEYYTPTHVAEGLWEAMKAHGFENGNVLDPCTGAGIFEGVKPKGAIMTGCDVDGTGAKIAQLLNPQDRIQNKPFEQVVMETPDNTFDGCITNVPFGDARGACAHDDPAYKDEKRIERYFILRALDKIKPGRLACFVVPTNIVGAKGGKWEGFRTAVSKKAEFLGAHKLPSKTFAAQGTDTVVDIAVFKKHPEDLLEKIDSLHTETLRETNVLWDEFITGMYWQGEGRKFIMGTYVPKVEGDRWSRETVDGDVDNESMKRKLAQRFNSRIVWDALETSEPVVKNYADGDRRIINGEEYEMQAGAWVKVHKADTGDSMVLEAAKYGAQTYGELKSLLSSPKGALKLTADQAFAVWKAFPKVLSDLQAQSIEFAMSQPKDEYREQLWRGSIIGGMIGRLKAAETENDPDNDTAAMRQDIQELVTSEISKYGHPKNNKGLVLTGESSRMFGMFVNAMDEKGQFSDLLAGNIANDHLTFDATSIQSVVEHLFLREGIQNIELEDVQKLYAGKRKIEALGDIAEIDGVAVTPEGMVMPMGRYCSGDIYPKLSAMTQAMAEEIDPRITAKYQQQIDRIMQRRKTTAAPDINFGLQQKWFSRKYIVDFLKENGYPRMDYGVFKKVEIEDAVSGEAGTQEKFVKDYEDPFGRFVGYGDASGWLKQLNQYLNGKNVTSSKQENKEAYQKSARALEDQFNVWMQQHPDIDQLVEKYNQKFNGYLEHEYGGEELKLEGVSPQVKLHDFQAAAIQRLSEEGRGCLALDVGLGKTYGALGLYAYNKQMGRSKKTCIVVPNAVLANWYHSSKKFLGNHNGVLTVGFKPQIDKDGNIVQEVVKDEKGQPKKNKHTGELEYRDALSKTDSVEEIWEDMWKIPQGNYSLVIMTQEKFGTIPMRPKTKRGYTDKMVERALISQKQADKAVNENSNGGKIEKEGTTYQEDKDRLHLEQAYADEGTRKKGELPFFEDMGFTDVIVDEVHGFKNSYSGGEQTQNIAYLPTAPSAKRALDMAMKMNYLRDSNNGRGPYLLSATPVTNSPFEIFNILSLCCPIEEFERFGVYTVDDFVRVFGQIEPVDKMTVSGEVKTMDGLTGFQNLDGLRNLFHKYTIMKNAGDVGLPLPPFDEHQDMVDMTDEQENVYVELREKAKEAAKKAGKQGGGGQGQKRPNPLFPIMRDMDRVTTDMDLYRHTMTFHFAAKDKDKVDALIEKMPDEIEVTIEEQGERVKQPVPFSHETRMEGNTYVLVVPESYEDLVVTKFPEVRIDETEVGHPVTPKYAKLIERLRKHFDENGKQLIFTEEKSQHEKLRRLIIHEVPVWQDVIGVINADTAKGDKIQKISNDYNSGKLKIIVANKKAEVGVNLQKGTTAIHHLTLPWTPASIQQRNGRGVRQGNTAEHIDIYYYLGKGSFDQYRLDLLQKKSNWMNELFKGTEATAENANAFQADEYVDMLESDPEEAKKRRMEKLAKKAAERKAREDMISVNMLQQLANNTHILENLDADKERVREDLKKKIPEYETKLTNYEKRIAEATDPEQKDLLRERVEAAKKALHNYQVRLKGLDESYAAKRTELEARNKQNSGVLRFRAKKEGLPFDESLIDHPENAVVTLTGAVIAKGGFYEVIKADDNDYAASNLRRSFGGKLIQVNEVNPVEKWLKAEPVFDYVPIATEYRKERGSITPINLWPAKDLKKVSYSADEIALKKMMTQEFTYQDMVQGKLSKDFFLEHVNEIKLANNGIWLIKTGDGLFVGYRRDIEDQQSILYPEPQNEDFKKQVCEAYLEWRRKGDAGWDEELMMRTLFGHGWEDIAMQYGHKATESEIRAAVASAFRYVMNELLPEDDGSVMIVKARMNKLNEKYHDGLDMAKKDLGAVDNLDDVDDIWMQLQHVEIDKMMFEKQRREDEERRKELENLKNDPNYKDVPPNITKAFLDLGITVKTNMTNMVAPGFKGRRGTSYEPFTRWFFQDDSGKSGRVYRQKTMFKMRYDAKFFQDAGDGFRGAWWHIPSTFDLKEIYEFFT